MCRSRITQLCVTLTQVTRELELSARFETVAPVVTLNCMLLFFSESVRCSTRIAWGKRRSRLQNDIDLTWCRCGYMCLRRWSKRDWYWLKLYADFTLLYTSWAPVLEQDITLYEMSPSWSRSLSFSLIHSFTHSHRLFYHSRHRQVSMQGI